MKAALATVEEATTAVLTLSEGLERDELMRARLTRAEVRRQLLLVATTLRTIDDDGRRLLPELDWDGWAATGARLQDEPSVAEDALWFAIRALTPATLTWLRLYRNDPPAGLATVP